MVKAFWCAVPAPAIVFLVHCVLTLGFNVYDRFTWFDVPMHFIGGVAIAHFFTVTLRTMGAEAEWRVGSATIFYIAVGELVGISTVIWEFAEFLADTVLELGAQRSVANTMKDQFFGLAGGLTYLIIARPAVAELNQ
jgi:hypothetical protein